MKFLICMLFSFVITSNVIAQDSVSFDQVMYKAPANWNFTDNGAYRTYSIINNAANTFCIISIYNSDVSSGNADQDFRKAWKGIVTGHFTVIKNLKPQQNKTANGISYLQDEATVMNDKGSFFARLLVFDLKQKNQAVLFLSSNKNSLTQYQSELDGFISSLQQNNSSTSVVNTNTNTNTNNTTSNNNNTNNPQVLTSSEGLTHFNHFIFKIPAGWKSTQQGAYLSLSPTDVPANESLIFLLMPSSSNTSFEDVGTSTINELAVAMNGTVIPDVTVGHPVYIRPHEGKTPKGWDYSMGTGQIKVQYTGSDGYLTSDQYDVGVFLAKINDRIERVVYLSKYYRCGIYGSSTFINLEYEPMITNFFFTISYDDYDTKVKDGKIANSEASGVWSGVSFVNRWNLQGDLSLVYDATFFLLFDNGQVYYGENFPIHGLYNLNTTAIAANENSYWGTYTFQNGSGIMKFQFRNIPFVISNGKLTAEMNGSKTDFKKIVVPSKFTLNGTWCEKGTDNCISLTPDGKFIDKRVIQDLEYAPTTCNYLAPEAGQGTYEIKDYSIIFHYNNGLIIQDAFPGMGLENGSSSPSMLFLGRQKKILEKK